MQYRTLADLSNLVRTNIHKIPHDIDLVVGIPRSGMLPASMIALFLNKKMTDLDSFLEGRIMGSGERSKYIHDGDIKKVLIVDDSVYGGGAMTKAKEKISLLINKYDLIFAAPIVTTHGKQFVDIFFEVIDGSRVFEWNLFHHSILQRSCVDIDGVINLDPEEDDDGPIYQEFLKSAIPLYTPTVKIGALISCRLEKYRPLTESWLKKHGIQYDKLNMLKFDSKIERLRWGRHGEYKGQFYRDGDYELFIESDFTQAQVIANISQKPVICISKNQLVLPHIPVSTVQKLKRYIKKKCPTLTKYYKTLLFIH